MKKWMKKIIALIIVLSLVCGLAPNLSLVVRAEEIGSDNEVLDNPTEEPGLEEDAGDLDNPADEPDVEGDDDSSDEPSDDPSDEPSDEPTDEPDTDEHVHTYGEPEFTWEEDFKSATATFTCVVDESTQVVDAKITKEVVVVPTETKAGERLYTATVTFEGITYTDAKTEEIPAGTILAVDSLKVANNANTIKISWAASEHVDGYLVYRRTAESSYKVVATVRGNENTSFKDQNTAKGIKYFYNVAAYRNDEDGRIVGPRRSVAAQIVRTWITSITNQNGSVKLNWTKVNGVEGYKVYRKSEGQEKYFLIKTIKSAGKNYYTDKAEKAIVNGKKSQYYIVPYYADSNNVVTKTSVKTNYYLKKEVISSVESNGSKALKVSWKKNNKATGYQIRYSRSESFDSYNTVKVTSKNTLSKTVKNLKSGKTYYVKVRAYKTVNGVTSYSAWSNVKTKKTK